MLKDDILHQAKEAFDNKNFAEALVLYRKIAICGNSQVLKDVGKAILCNNRMQIIDKGALNASTRKEIIAYLSAGLMYEKNTDICMDMIRTDRYSDDLECQKSHYYLRLIRQNVKPQDEHTLLTWVEREEEILNPRFPLPQPEEPLNDLDYFWAIAAPFWVVRYREDASTKAMLERCTSKITHERFTTCSIDPHSRKKMPAWHELKTHLNCPSPVLYLIYVEEEFNRPEVVNLIANTMRLYGCEIQLYEWKSINTIPEEVVLLVLSDSALFAESQKPVAEQAPYYQRIQQHTGKRIWIPWQIPAEISLPEYWVLLPGEWQNNWVRIKISLLHDPLEALDKILKCLLENPENLPAIRQLQEKKTRPYREVIKSLITEKSAPFDFGAFLNLMFSLGDRSRNLYYYLFLNAPGFSSSYIICEKYCIRNIRQLNKYIRNNGLKYEKPQDYALLESLGVHVLECFDRQELKTPGLFREMSCLAYSQNPKILKKLFRNFFYYFLAVEKNIEKINNQDDFVEILCSFSLTLRLMAGVVKLSKSELRILLDSLMTHLPPKCEKGAYAEKYHYLLKTISLVLVLMKCANIEEREYLAYLKKLKNLASSSLMPFVKKTMQMLGIICNDESIGDEMRWWDGHLLMFSINMISVFSSPSLFFNFSGLLNSFLVTNLQNISIFALGSKLNMLQSVLTYYFNLDEDCKDGFNHVVFFLHNLEKKIKMWVFLAAAGMLHDFVIQPHNILSVHILAIDLIVYMVQETLKMQIDEVVKVVHRTLLAYLRFYSQADEIAHSGLRSHAKNRLEQLGAQNDVVQNEIVYVNLRMNNATSIESNVLFCTAKKNLENLAITNLFSEVYGRTIPRFILESQKNCLSVRDNALDLRRKKEHFRGCVYKINILLVLAVSVCCVVEVLIFLCVFFNLFSFIVSSIAYGGIGIIALGCICLGALCEDASKKIIGLDEDELDDESNTSFCGFLWRNIGSSKVEKTENTTGVLC